MIVECKKPLGLAEKLSIHRPGDGEDTGDIPGHARASGGTPTGGGGGPRKNPPEPVTIIEPKKINLLRALRNSLFAGIVVAAPIAITIYLVTSFIGWVDKSILPLVPDRFLPDTYLPFTVPGAGLLFALLGLIVLGALARNLFGRAFLEIGEGFVERMPVVRNVYKALKQIFETVLAKSETTFQEVAIIEYPRPGLYAIAFVTTRTKGEVQDKLPGEMVSVFVPTTPNPTSGFLLFVKKSDLIMLDMSVEDAAKIVISAGLVTPEKMGVGKRLGFENKKRSSGLTKLFSKSQPDRKRRKASSRSKR